MERNGVRSVYFRRDFTIKTLDEFMHRISLGCNILVAD